MGSRRSTDPVCLPGLVPWDTGDSLPCVVFSTGVPDRIEQSHGEITAETPMFLFPGGHLSEGWNLQILLEAQLPKESNNNGSIGGVLTRVKYVTAVPGRVWLPVREVPCF